MLKHKMRQRHSNVARLVLGTFIAMIFLNFYINVWVKDADDIFDLDSSSVHRGRRKAYVWTSGQRLWNNDTNGDNATLKNVLRYPETATVSMKLYATSPYSDRPIIWRDLQHYTDDRILAQMKYVPPGTRRHARVTVKKIFLNNGFKDWDMKPGIQSFIDQDCPVYTCMVTDRQQDSRSADAILFRQYPRLPWFNRPPSQIWILYMLESPYFTPKLSPFANMFNWTATYRHDSDIVTPYEKFVKYQKPPQHIQTPLARNYAAGKTKKVAWFASNCRASNQRLQYAYELSRYIDVDIYGKCGSKKCPRHLKNCFDILDTDYKFYLAFENSNCRDYITEKFFVTGLQHDVIPIVMGAAPEDYKRVAPHYSYIHVDEYGSPKVLAEYLNELDKNDDLYNEYFIWKGTGSFINTSFWCRLCAMLHDESRSPSYYDNIEEWWRGRNVCIGKHRWSQHPRKEPYISDYYKAQKRSFV